ncbi:MAG: DUF4351 domain-containing protein [Cyanobacteriota bacterium]|nr:DUF4351 domain-containing protein [Cyanobacteriota bacterium]
MSELKRFWVLVHYETELTAENEDEACLDILMGNTIVEGASLVVQELSSDADAREAIARSRAKVRKKSALAIIIRKLCYKLKDYTWMFEGLPAEIQAKVDELSLEQLEDLSIEALEFSSADDLSAYLERTL